MQGDLSAGVCLRAVGSSSAYASLTYTSFMAMTTIRVESAVRDQLAARAEAHGRSLGAELRAMLDEMMWQGIEAGYRRLATPQEEMAAYQAEAAERTSAGLRDLPPPPPPAHPEHHLSPPAPSPP